MRRRELLKTTGTAALGTTALSSGIAAAEDTDTLHVNIYWAKGGEDGEFGSRPGTLINLAEEAAKEIESQAGVPVTTWDLGGVSTSGFGNDDTYCDILKTFLNSDDLYKYTGESHVLLYKRTFDNSAHTGAAYINDGDSSPCAENDGDPEGDYYGLYDSNYAFNLVANAPYDTLGSTAFKNTVIQEICHPLVDHTNAPDPDNEHSIGTQYHEGGDLAGTHTSPMLTWYSGGTYSGDNPEPDTCCDQNDVYNSTEYSIDMSYCATDEVWRWMTYEYDSDYYADDG